MLSSPALDPGMNAGQKLMLALLGKLLLRHIAAIGGAALQQPVGDFRVPRPELRLVIFVAIPIEAKPAQVGQLLLEQVVRAALGIVGGRVCRLGIPVEAGRVRGVSGLRVVDASIMPVVTSGNTNAPSLYTDPVTGNEYFIVTRLAERYRSEVRRWL